MKEYQTGHSYVTYNLYLSLNVIWVIKLRRVEMSKKYSINGRDKMYAQTLD
jgi:hypothetical protein